MPGIYSKRRQLRMRQRFAKVKTLALVWAVEAVVPKTATIIDLGSGFGRFVQQLRDAGYNAFGVDGTEGIEGITDGLVQQYDLTKNCSALYGIADWATFFELGEHVPVENETALMDQVCAIPRVGIIATWAIVGDIGKGHVNCREPEYVKELFRDRGWSFDPIATDSAKTGADQSNLSRLRRLLVFRR